jgi:hypothetical protein
VHAGDGFGTRLRRPALGALLLLVLAVAWAPAVLQGATSLERDGTGAGAGTTTHGLFPRFEGAVPVLLYHRLAPGAVTPAAFYAQMSRVHELGFEAITLDQYVRFIRGDAIDLPQRPILITFDDAFLSSWEDADPVLARYGWSAVMYVPTGLVGLPGRMTWDQLRKMALSGRWQIDEHAGDGHVLTPVDASGRRAPFYANELWTDGRQETFTHYTDRVSGDIELGLSMLERNLPGWTSHGSFAVPFGNYGQMGSNDPRIEPWLSSFLRKRFAVIFAHGDNVFTTPGPGFADRLRVAPDWDAQALETQLLSGFERLQPRAVAGVSRASTRTPS